MQQSYTKNYFKIYLWQGVSLVLNFLSMFVVIPYLTSDPTTYGIYSICISFSIFLAYADFGFIGAGQKYAAEYFARGEIKEEIKVIGFTNFILLLFLLVFSLGFLTLSFQPELLVKGLTNYKQESIASSLLLILAFFTPITFLQRLLQMIFGIRMEDFVIQRTNIVASIFKLVSVLWFFRMGQYDIVGYFLFTQIINLFAALFTLFIAKRRYDYDFISLIKSIRFNRDVYGKTKGLAFTSLYLTVSWILYYELDTVSIGKLLGANQVAIYAVGLTILTFFRSILGIIFSPFNIRFNHFIGTNEEGNLKLFVLQVVSILAPIIVLPIITIAMLAYPFVLSWVGPNYIKSVEIIRFLIFCNFFAFIAYPISTLLMAKERQNEMYLIATLLPLLFWGGILLTYNNLGVISFAIFKLLAFALAAFVYYNLMLKFLEMSFMQSVKKIFKPMFFPILFILFSTYLVKDYLPTDKAKLNLLIVSVCAGCLLIIAFVIQYLFSENWRDLVGRLIKSYRKE